MTQEEQMLIQILAAFINGRSISLIQDVSLEALYQAAQKHNVAGIVCSMIQSVLKTCAEDSAARKFQEIYMATIFRSVQMEEEVKLFADRMDEAGIPYAFFKGYELRELYPEYYGAAEPPVRCGVSHLSGLTEPPVYSYSA